MTNAPGHAGVFATVVGDAGPGTLYKFVLDDRELPDPFARFLPFGVHGPAAVTAVGYRWQHEPAWARPLRAQVIYELHVGAFTAEGTYAAAAARLPALVELGVTAVELMPIAAFAGTRGWGYDGVALCAPFAPYGTPDELCAFVDAAHGLGLAVLLDVVYNHFGPAGNYLGAYASDYFLPDHQSAWGDAPNHTHPGLRQLVTESARMWLEDYRFDGLRLDATHAIYDTSEVHLLAELAMRARAIDSRKLICAEDERNEPALVTRDGLDALWADDFHHAVRTTLTGEQEGYYGGYAPGAATVAAAINGGWLYHGQRFGPTGKGRGGDATALPAEAFIYCISNHDQVGNRAFGDRLSHVVPPAAFAAASTLLLFLPMTPLIFMGQEWATRSPFLFFTDHDPDLGVLIREGRRREFKDFPSIARPAPGAEIPDPQAEATFHASKLDWGERDRPGHAEVLALYQKLLRLRREDAVIAGVGRAGLHADSAGALLLVTLVTGDGRRHLAVNFSPGVVDLDSFAAELAGTRAIFASFSGGLPAPTAALPGFGAVIFAS